MKIQFNLIEGYDLSNVVGTKEAELEGVDWHPFSEKPLPPDNDSYDEYLLAIYEDDVVHYDIGTFGWTHSPIYGKQTEWTSFYTNDYYEGEPWGPIAWHPLPTRPKVISQK